MGEWNSRLVGVCAQNGYLIIHLLFSSRSFFYDSSTSRPWRWSEKRVVKPWRAYGDAIPGAVPSPRLHFSATGRTTSFTLLHSTTLGGGSGILMPRSPSAFYSPAHSLSFLSSLTSSSPPIAFPSSMLRSWLLESVCTLSLVLFFPLFFPYSPPPPCIRE